MRNKFYKKIVFYVIILGVFNSCKVLEVENASKEKHIAGVSIASDYTLYKFEIEAPSVFKITSISLHQGEGDTLRIKEYDFIDNSTSSGHRVKNFEESLQKGEYIISFRVDKKDNPSDSFDSLTLGYILNDKNKETKLIKIISETIKYNR